MAKRSFQRFPLMLGSHHILFKAPAVVSDEVYIPSALVVLFHYANVLVKALTLLFTQISTVVWKIVQVVRLQKMQFDGHSCPELAATLKLLFNFLLVFCTRVVSQEVCNYSFQLLPGGEFSFAQCFGKHWILHEFFYLSGVKYTSREFLHAYPLELLLEESKTTASPVRCLHKVLPYFKLNMYKWKQYFVQFNEVRLNVMPAKF